MAEMVMFGPMLMPKWIALTALVAAIPMWLALMAALAPKPRTQQIASNPRR